MSDVSQIGQILQHYIPGVIIADEQGIILWADDTARSAYENKELVARRFQDAFSWNIAELLFEARVYKSIMGEKYRFSAHRILYDGKNYFIISINEMTDLNNQESRLYCLEQIFQSIKDGVIVSDYKGRLQLYNASQEKMEDLSAGEVIGRYLWDVYNYNPELSEHRKVYKSGKPILNKYRAHSYKEGVPRYVSYSTYPLIRDGEVVAVYSVSNNETQLQSLLATVLEIKREQIGTALEDKKSRGNGTSYTFSDIVGESSVIKSLIKEAETIALMESTVLLIGDTGTGKEVFAQSIHNFSKNNKEPFIGINCAAIPDTLLESILFGTVKGAFTGAVDQSGLFEEARGGTLFLDEINSMPLSLQAKLLRVLQEKTVRRVGGLGVRPVHCRVMCASNEEPRKIIAEGRLRQDFFYRIGQICLYIPPLRQRKEDIMALTKFFINKCNAMLRKNIRDISPELEELVLSYDWPGNIRELEHLIENLMIRTGDNKTVLGLDDMPTYLKGIFLSSSPVKAKADSTLPDLLHVLEKKVILDTLNKNDWHFNKTAKDLGIIRQSLSYRMKRLGISRENRE